MAELPRKHEVAAPAPIVSQHDGDEAETPLLLKSLLLSDVARTDDLVPPRRKF